MTADEHPGGDDAKALDLSTVSPDTQTPKHFHLHLVSDSSGETLSTIAKAAVVQMAHAKPNRHMHPLVRNPKQLSTVLQHIETSPGIVLYTLMNPSLAQILEIRCAELGVPCVAVLKQVLEAFEDYLKMPVGAVIAGQHILNEEYFRRIEAMNFSQAHDDSLRSEDLERADIVLIGASRTSKTPTSLYLANRGFKTANVSLVPNIPAPANLTKLQNPMVVGLIASPERVAEVRRNRLLSLNSERFENYVDAEIIKEEMALTKKLCGQHRWPVVDVTRRSIEETAASIIALFEDRRRRLEREQNKV